MEDYYEQFNDTLDKALQELSTYVYHILNIGKGGFDLYQYEYIDETLAERLFRYPDKQVIPKLQGLLQSLQIVTRKKINEAIPDERYWDSDEVISKENTRQQLFEGAKNTIAFITNIIEARQKINDRKPLNLLNYRGSERKLNQFKAELKEYYNDTPYFNAVFRGQAPNERINWIMPKHYFRYFMRELFKKLGNRKSVNWEIVSNSFTLEGKSITSSFKGNNADNDVSQEFKTKINTAFDKLLN
ncbi:hypothetical protein [Dysgonomonas reticulitermitis]